ncbi:hypothetical protein DL93DRAFT_2102640 [Clavulina sp. PMI_390]|nr:hypothetical protein DL93DRAFT_2102640 [Clavulina sp. PMI_390]
MKVLLPASAAVVLIIHPLSVSIARPPALPARLIITTADLGDLDDLEQIMDEDKAKSRQFDGLAARAPINSCTWPGGCCVLDVTLAFQPLLRLWVFPPPSITSQSKDMRSLKLLICFHSREKPMQESLLNGQSIWVISFENGAGLISKLWGEQTGKRGRRETSRDMRGWESYEQQQRSSKAMSGIVVREEDKPQWAHVGDDWAGDGPTIRVETKSRSTSSWNRGEDRAGRVPNGD